jgi:phage terminase large subunit-like protein
MTLTKEQLSLCSEEQHRIAKLRVRHFNNLLLFTQVFFKHRTGRDFELSNPPGRPSHYLTIAKALEKVVRGETKRLLINVPPRYGKSELVIHFVAWAMAKFKDSNFLYVSYSHTLAKKQTQTIRDIITLPQYKDLFDIKLKDDTTAKDNFETLNGGSVYAAGAQGTITGFGAGIKGSNRFGGCIVIDDIHKPDEVTSDTIRESINEWYFNTLQSRLNNPNTPIIFIGQRLHEDDLAANLIQSGDWETVILPAIDIVGNPLHPKMHDLKILYKMKEESPYNFASQYQQNPQPAGGGIFKKECFHLHDIEPEILETFITVDSAETDKNYNDWTVFSFWGLYKIKDGDIETDEYALHWLDCVQLHIEPKDLLNEFRNFYRDCTHHRVRPKIVGIEKKSTGVTLSSVLSNLQGLQVIDIDRTKASGSKTTRFLEMQSFIGRRLISLPAYGNHTPMCIEHMVKITSNNSHRFDDICDTAYDAIRLALIEKVILNKAMKKEDKEFAKNFMSNVRQTDRLKRDAYKN